MRGLKLPDFNPRKRYSLSHPLRMRGLKQLGLPETATEAESHPLRMRGLKPNNRCSRRRQCKVASFTDAWIETHHCRNVPHGTVSHPLRMRGLKPDVELITELRALSHPLRMRGLKPQQNMIMRTLCRRILYGCVD